MIYGPLTFAGFLWARFGGHRRVWVFDDPWLQAPGWARLLVSLGLGWALAFIVVGATPWLVRRAEWARALHAELKQIIEPLSGAEITALAVASGLGEEVFFRGAMQPVLGLLITSLIFGAFHLGPTKTFPAWALWAFAVGLALGSIFQLTGMLWGSILAHVWINQRNMAFLKRH